jgi:plasmid maintenance system antidote protein VapI
MGPAAYDPMGLGEFLERMELSQYRLAKNIRVPARRINECTHAAI